MQLWIFEDKNSYESYFKQSLKLEQIELDELPCTYFDLRDYVGANCVRPPFGGNAEKGACNAPLQNTHADIPQLETEIDRLVYDLYGLTVEEIAVVEGKP